MRAVIFILFVCLGLFITAGPASAEEIIRYKPLLVQSGEVDVSDPMVLIVDTKDGHLWLWEQKNERPDNDTVVSVSRLTYQGTVGPGPRVGLPDEGKN